MKIHEYQANLIFKEAGLPVVSGKVATEVSTAVKIAEDIGYPVVLKSQVLVGGRGKAGGIKVVNNKEELEKKFQDIKGLKIKGYAVEEIFVVKAIEIKKEYYLGLTIDNAKEDIVLIASSEGGVEIEETAKMNPDAIKKFYLEGKKEIDKSRWPDFISQVFDVPSQQEEGTAIFEKLIEVFFANDCTLVEINPLVVDGTGTILAIDAKINFDDNGMFRQEKLAELRDLKYEDPDELEAKESGLSFVKLDGDIGCIVNGAGLAMATLDIVKLLGGDPANFLDVGGSSSPEKVLNALTIILRNKKVKAVLVNIFGGITRCDDIAKGIIEARSKIDISVPLIVRLTGTNEEEAKALLAENNITTYATMREVVERAVALAK